MKKSSIRRTLYHVFIYVVLAMLAITIIVPVAWVFMASIKQNSEFYGNPWALPAGLLLAELCGCLDNGPHGRVHAQLRR